MSPTYNLKLTSGRELTTIYPFESNGVDNKSVPKPVTVERSPYGPAFVVPGDFMGRFVEGFEFEIVGKTVYDGEYFVERAEYVRGNTYVFVEMVPADPLPQKVTSSIAPLPPMITYKVLDAASSLKLVGQGAAMYNEDLTWGHAMQLNMLHMLENFASDKAPASPVEGQLWYETNSKRLRVFDGSVFIDVTPEQLTETFTKVFADKLYMSVGGGQMTGSLILSANPSDPLEAATKQYVDSLANGVIWVVPIVDPNLFDDSLTSPVGLTNVAFNRTYIVNGTGEGEWTGFDAHAMQFDGTEWTSILGRPVQVGDRFGVFFGLDDNKLPIGQPQGGLVGNAGSIATVVSVAPISYVFDTPVEPDAVAVKTTQYGSSLLAGRSYTFRGTYGRKMYGVNYRWIEFSGPQLLAVGQGLRYNGNVLTVDANRFGSFVSSAPASSNAAGKHGDWYADDEYIYTYGVTGWRRVASQTF